MNSMFKLNCRYDIEMNEADFGAPMTIGLRWAVFFKRFCRAVFKFCRFYSLYVKNLLRPKRQSSDLEVEASLSFED